MLISCRIGSQVADDSKLWLRRIPSVYLAITAVFRHPTRCQQLIATYEQALGRLLAWLGPPTIGGRLPERYLRTFAISWNDLH